MTQTTAATTTAQYSGHLPLPAYSTWGPADPASNFTDRDNLAQRIHRLENQCLALEIRGGNRISHDITLQGLCSQIDSLNQDGLHARYQILALVHILTKTPLNNPNTLSNELESLAKIDKVSPEERTTVDTLLARLKTPASQIKETGELLVTINNPEERAAILNIFNTLSPDTQNVLFKHLASLVINQQGLSLDDRAEVASAATPENQLIQQKTFIQLIICAGATGALFTKVAGALLTKEPLNTKTKAYVGALAISTTLLGAACYSPTKTAKQIKRFSDFVDKNKKPILYTIGGCALAAGIVWAKIKFAGDAQARLASIAGDAQASLNSIADAARARLPSAVQARLTSTVAETTPLDIEAIQPFVRGTLPFLAQEAVQPSEQKVARPFPFNQVADRMEKAFKATGLEKIVTRGAERFVNYVHNTAPHIRETFKAGVNNFTEEETLRFQ